MCNKGHTYSIIVLIKEKMKGCTYAKMFKNNCLEQVSCGRDRIFIIPEPKQSIASLYRKILINTIYDAIVSMCINKDISLSCIKVNVVSFLLCKMMKTTKHFISFVINIPMQKGNYTICEHLSSSCKG